MSFTAPFLLKPSLKAELERYGLMDGIDLMSPADIEMIPSRSLPFDYEVGDPVYRLKPEVAEELSRDHKSFDIEKALEELVEALRLESRYPLTSAQTDGKELTMDSKYPALQKVLASEVSDYDRALILGNRLKVNSAIQDLQSALQNLRGVDAPELADEVMKLMQALELMQDYNKSMVDHGIS